MKKFNLFIMVCLFAALILAGAGCKKGTKENNLPPGGEASQEMGGKTGTKDEAATQYEAKQAACKDALEKAIERNEIYFRNVESVAGQNKEICKNSCDTSSGAGSTAECWQNCIDQWESELSVINARKIQTDEYYYKCLENK